MYHCLLKHHAKHRFLWSLIGLFLVNDHVFGELPPRPSLDAINPSAQYLPPAQGAIGRLELTTGNTTVYGLTAKVRVPGTFGTPLASGDVVVTSVADSSRCRVILDNGDYFHLGPGSFVGVAKEGNVYSVNLWDGRLIAYALPTLDGKRGPLVIQTSQGTVGFSAGKVGITGDEARTELFVFSGIARWAGHRRATPNDVGTGMHLTDIAGMVDIAAGSPDDEERLTARVSPEPVGIKTGIAAYRKQDYDAAEEVLSQVQSSFPYNATAALYLGRTYLRLGQRAPAIAQWKKYSWIDPDGAKEKGITEKLATLATK